MDAPHRPHRARRGGPGRCAVPHAWLLAAVLVWPGPTSAAAQPPDPAPAAGQHPKQTAEPGEDDVDVLDVLGKLRHREESVDAPDEPWDPGKPMLAVAPIIGYKPSTGTVIGAASQLAVYFGDPQTTRISSAVMSLTFSSKKQTSITARFGTFTRDDVLRVEGDNRFQWTSQDSYGLGTSTSPSDSVNARFNYFRIFETVFYELREGLFAGVGAHYSAHTDIRPGQGADAAWNDSTFVEYSQRNGFDASSQTSAGVSLNLLVDTRDNPINASRGWLASASYRPFFKHVLGGDSTWQELLLDVRAFKRVSQRRRHTLAVWLYGDFVTNGTAPYFDLPTIGMDTYGRSGRGYVEGRFRGERLLYGEVEYRATLTRNGLLGMVAFASTSTYSNLQNDERLFDSFAPAGGAGLRLLFNKRSRANLCLDVAWGQQGSRGVYLALQEAF